MLSLVPFLIAPGIPPLPLTINRPIREICNLFRIHVGKKFGDFWKRAVASFVFLRFFCPACVAPDAFKLLEGGATFLKLSLNIQVRI